jgi:hypothetical protein
MNRAALPLLSSLGILLIAACSTPVENYCDENTPCLDPALPFCDLHGVYPGSHGVGRTCVPNPFDASVPESDAAVPVPDAQASCSPSTTVCEKDQLVVCDADGNVAESTTCTLGCHSSGERCNDLRPSNVGMTSCLDAALTAADFSLSDGAEIDTDSGEITNGDGNAVFVNSTIIEAPNGGVGVRCFQVGELTLGDVTVKGTNAIAIAANGAVAVNGILSISGLGGNQAGAGALSSCTGGAASACDADNNCGGGGGGGYGSPGANGGSADTASGGQGSGVSGNETLIPLRGGCRGALGRNMQLFGQPYVGGAGGAIQIASRVSITVGAGNFISANGAGGHRAPTLLCNGATCGSGSGGNSGGGVLLEAPTVEIAGGGGIAANGGGGGCLDDAGEPGQNSGVAALGGNCSGNFGDGGSGAAGTDVAHVGANGGSGTYRGGGGGGGGVGRIRINVRGSFEPAVNAILSPTPSSGAVQVR